MRASRGPVVALAVVTAVAACGRGEPGAVPEVRAPADVAVSRPLSTGAVAAFPATLEAVNRAELATRAAGIVERVTVDVGDRVRAGQALVVLDDADVEARIRRAEAAVRQASRSFERIESLERDGAATAQELDDARARLEMAEAGLAEARAQRGYVVLRAPFAGVVVTREVDPGDLASPGRPVLGLVGEGALEVTADLPAEYAGRVRPGDSLMVVDPETGSRLPARVSRLSPALREDSRRFRLEAELTGEGGAEGFRPGGFVRLELPEPGRTTWWIPTDAVVERGQLSGTFVVERDTLRLRWIRTGRRRAEALEVLAGLDGAAAVVRRPGPALEDGLPVGSVRAEEFGTAAGVEAR